MFKFDDFRKNPKKKGIFKRIRKKNILPEIKDRRIIAHLKAVGLLNLYPHSL